MPYATLADLLLRFERPDNAEVSQLAPDGEGGRDDTKIAAHLVEASGEMDGYLGVQHPLPLASVSDEAAQRLTQVCCDIARYRLWADAASEEVARRYKEAVAWLERVADGNVHLLPPPSGGPQRASASAAAVVMTRQGLRGVL